MIQTYVVDPDREIRRSVNGLLTAKGYSCRPFACGEDFVDELPHLAPGVIALCLESAVAENFRLLDELRRRELNWPVVMLSEGATASVAIAAMKRGADDVVEDVADQGKLLAAFADAQPVLDARVRSSDRSRRAKMLISLLTPREIEVLKHLAAGCSNKSIASAMGISVRTVEMHRHNMLSKLNAATAHDATRLALDAGLELSR